MLTEVGRKRGRGSNKGLNNLDEAYLDSQVLVKLKTDHLFRLKKVCNKIYSFSWRPLHLNIDIIQEMRSPRSSLSVLDQRLQWKRKIPEYHLCIVECFQDWKWTFNFIGDI